MTVRKLNGAIEVSANTTVLKSETSCSHTATLNNLKSVSLEVLRCTCSTFSAQAIVGGDLRAQLLLAYRDVGTLP